MRRLQINHVTEYRFPRPVTLLPHRLMLRPRENHNVRIESSSLQIVPHHRLQWKRDVLDNSVAVVAVAQASDLLRVESDVTILNYEWNPFDFLLDDFAVSHPFDYAQRDRIELAPFLQSVYPADRPAIAQWLTGLGLQRPMQTLALLDRISHSIASGLGYRIREEPGVQSPSETLRLQSGSCRDFAALFMEACRYLGLASRFVSGYLFTWAGDSSNASTHAWAEVYLPGGGWKGFDATSGAVTSDQHIAVAVSRHPEAVPPVAGDYVGTSDDLPSLSVTVRVSEIV